MSAFEENAPVQVIIFPRSTTGLLNMTIPFESILLASTYHTMKGGALGLVLAWIYRRWGKVSEFE